MIKALVPVPDHGWSELIQIPPPANHGAGIARAWTRDGGELLPRQRIRVVLHALTALFEHHIALAPELLRFDLQVAHALGFEFERQRQTADLVLLVIGRVVVRGKGVAGTAETRNQLREFARFQVTGVLEHQVFQYMGQPGAARRFVGAAHAVPDHDRGNRCAVVLAHQHLHVITQAIFMSVRIIRCPGRSGQQYGRQHSKQRPLISQAHSFLPQAPDDRISSRF